jgi:hypothetical protein
LGRLAHLPVTAFARSTHLNLVIFGLSLFISEYPIQNQMESSSNKAGRNQLIPGMTLATKGEETM